MPLYSFACFKILEAICNKLDAITRSFWWGHKPGVKNLHLVNWDTLCQPKNRRGLGLRKFNLINKSLLSEQYWRIQRCPNSLMAKTFKPKYFPNSNLQSYILKPHYSWIWLLPFTLPYTKVVGLLEKIFIYPSPILIGSIALNKP